MSSVFEFKENEVKDLKNQVIVLEQCIELQKQTNISVDESLRTKEKEINDLKLVISRLEQNLYDNDISTSKKIDTFLKEISEKSQTIKTLTSQLKEMDKLNQNNEKNKNIILDLQKEISQIKTVMIENERIHINERNRYVNELQQKSQDMFILKDEIETLRTTIEKNENKIVDHQNYIDEINLKNESLIASEEEFKLILNDYKNNNEKLQDTIKLIQEEEEIKIKTMKLKIEENQLEFDNLNTLYKEMLGKLNQDKLNNISVERSIESVIKDYNLLTEENAYLKKERQKMLQMCHDMLKKYKIDFENLKSFVKEQLAEWSLLFIKHIQQLKLKYSSQIELYLNNLVETKDKLKSIQKAYSILRTDSVQSLEYFKIEIIEKCNEDVINKMIQNNEELEKRKVDLIRLHEEIDRKYNYQHYTLQYQ